MAKRRDANASVTNIRSGMTPGQKGGQTKRMKNIAKRSQTAKG